MLSGLSDGALRRHLAGVAEMAFIQGDQGMAERFIALAYLAPQSDTEAPVSPDSVVSWSARRHRCRQQEHDVARGQGCNFDHAAPDPG